MKWFQHQANSSLDAKLQEVLLDYGLEGYGLYWYCLELVSMNVEATNLTFELEHDCRIIARNTGSTPQKVTEMMTSFVKLGLFDQADGIITCLSLMKKCDEYTSKLLKNNVSGQCRDKVRSNRIEENKVDKNIKPLVASAPVDSEFETFWVVYDKKEGRHKCELKFKKISKEDRNSLFKVLNSYIRSTPDKQYRKNPLTWLNGKHWNDEITTPVNQSPDLSSTDWAGDKVFDKTYLER